MPKFLLKKHQNQVMVGKNSIKKGGPKPTPLLIKKNYQVYPAPTPTLTSPRPLPETFPFSTHFPLSEIVENPSATAECPL